MKIEVPQDRKSSFEPQVVKKGLKDISDIDHINVCKGNDNPSDFCPPPHQRHFGFDVSEGFIRASGLLISDVTDKILVQLEEWQHRPLDDVYLVIFIDAIHYFSQRQQSDCQKSRLGNSWTYLWRA